MEDDRSYNFNFWPAFADLMLCLILILLLVIGGAYFSSINIRSIQEKQKQIAQTLVTPERVIQQFNGGAEIRDRQGRTVYRLVVDPNDPMLQTISFSDSLLFKADDYRLKEPDGKDALMDVGRILVARLEDIAEIQIRGHADTYRTKNYTDNLELASRRANEVFRFLTQQVGIDPAQHLVSATSFGEFSPVQRKRDAPFDALQLEKSNSSDVFRQANRRIELVLFFRRPSAHSAVRPKWNRTR
jgi:flagellar motor protein MotB